jgi:hypothetical protein
VLVMTAALVLAGCSSGGAKKKATATTTTSSTPATAVTGEALSPAPGSTQGSSGVGVMVDLVFRTKDPLLLPAAVRTAGPGTPGTNPVFAGLEVTLSGTDPALGGPTANLANLFQTVAVSQLADGTREVRAVWISATGRFGVGVDSTLEAYVVRGVAPTKAPPDLNGLDVVSNVIHVQFHIGGQAPSTSTSSPTPPASSTTPAPTTTVRRTTTTARVLPTTTTATTSPPTSPPVT